jgi:hypothetical protein
MVAHGSKPMKGNWYGRYDGSNTGQMVVELDDRGDHFEVRWSRLFGQLFRFDEWSLCRG